MHLYCSLPLLAASGCVAEVGGDDPRALARGEPSVKYHPALCGVLTTPGRPRLGPWQVGSLTGAVASERVTEARARSPRRGRYSRL